MRPILPACIALAAASCTTPSPNPAEVISDPRQGKEESEVCFTNQIRNWRTNDVSSVIVEKGLKEEYKLDLAGDCHPEHAFSSIGLISRVGGGLCLSTGDRLVTDAHHDHGACTILRIYEWRKDADGPSAN